MNQSFKPRSNGLKMIILSILLVILILIPALEPYSVYIFLAAVVLLIVGIIAAIRDAIYNRRMRRQSQTQASAPAPISAPASTSAPSAKPAPAPAAKKAAKVERVHVHGESHYVDNFVAVASENEDYHKTKKELAEDHLDERVYQYEFFVKAGLKPDPDNEYDPNAIMVLADGLCIGHVPKGSTAHVRKLMESGRILRMELNIGGGKYKEVYENDDGEYELDQDKLDYSAVLELYLSDEE